MIRFEIKKIFSKTANKIGLAVLMIALAVTCYCAIAYMDYVDENGDMHIGITAVRQLRDTKKRMGRFDYRRCTEGGHPAKPAD